LNDYEGIRGFEDFRGDLGLMYFPTIQAETGALAILELVPTQIRNLKVNDSIRTDVLWLKQTLNRE
jgi:hypothetical protein